MLRLLLGQLRFRPGRAGALGVAVLVAAASFVLLTSAARTTAVRVQGSVETNYRTAYDILVRPRGSFTELERSRGLVRNNYLSGISGGITLSHYEQIKRISGVEIAAPIANVGYIMPFQKLGISVTDLLDTAAVQMFRVRSTLVAHNGASRYPDSASYVYFTRRNRFVSLGGYGISEVVPGRADPVEILNSFNANNKPTPTGPFADDDSFISIYSARSPELWRRTQGQLYGGLASNEIGTLMDVYFPVFVAAIDPAAEARLLNLDEAVVAGRYLRKRDRTVIRGLSNSRVRFVPVLASSQSYVGDVLDLTIERLRLLSPSRMAAILAGPGGRQFARETAGTVVDRRRIPFGRMYRRLLAGSELQTFSFWTVSDVRYARQRGRLFPQRTTNPKSVWVSSLHRNTGGGYWPAPPDNQDVQFRRLHPHPASNLFEGNLYLAPRFQIVGRYDPAKLPGFSPLSRVPLETYYPPELQPADERSRRVLGGKPLLPTQNLGDYVQQPPLLLTTLEGMKPFFDPRAYKGVNAKAPISVIRVRVAGVKGPDELSQERVKAVAVKIREQTGLDVDITVGSSPRELLVELPKGKFGRPALLLKEGWVKKGVSVSFLNALARKDLALFTLIPLICGFFLANGAFASARARRREIGTLLCLGWSQRAIFAVVLGEIALIGLLAGLLGTALAALAVWVFPLEVSLLRVLLVLPLSLLLAVLAGLLPAWRAARSVPLDAVRPAVAGKERSGRVRRMGELAAVNLRRAPARTLVGSLGLFVGVAALTLMLAINQAFQGTLVGTLLGDAISLQIRAVDFLAVGLVIALAALSLADVLFLNLRERAAELVTLRTFGWEDAHLRKLVALEALGLGLIGSLSGALVGLAVGVALLNVPLLPLLGAALLAVLGGLLVALAASLLPLSQIGRLTPPTVLAAE